jgi:hypothetical protein
MIGGDLIAKTSTLIYNQNNGMYEIKFFSSITSSLVGENIYNPVEVLLQDALLLGKILYHNIRIKTPKVCELSVECYQFNPYIIQELTGSEYNIDDINKFVEDMCFSGECTQTLVGYEEPLEVGKKTLLWSYLTICGSTLRVN